MAIKRRKLIPSYAGNDPYLYYIPPSLSPPPASFCTSQGQHVSTYTIILVTILSSLFLLVSYYIIIVKYCSIWNFFSRLPRWTQPGGAGEDFLNENSGVEIDHPIWYITTVGLQPSVINSITVSQYKKGKSLINGTICSVCLTEFQNDETLRLLPKCNHGFHIHCIDTWLRSHTNCPLCRTVIVSNASTTASPDPSANSNSSMENQNSSTVNDLNQGDQSENAENYSGSENNNVELRAGTEDEIEIPQAVRRSVSMDMFEV